jgi:hypothetical protein
VPTFGHTDTGNTDDELNLDMKQMSRFQAPANGTITKLTLYCWVYAGTPVIKGVVYADSGGVPGALLGVSSEATVPSSVAWVDLSGLNVTITNGTFYWIGYIVGDSGSDHVYDRVQIQTGINHIY